MAMAMVMTMAMAMAMVMTMVMAMAMAMAMVIIVIMVISNLLEIASGGDICQLMSEMYIQVGCPGTGTAEHPKSRPYLLPSQSLAHHTQLQPKHPSHSAKSSEE